MSVGFLQSPVTRPVATSSAANKGWCVPDVVAGALLGVPGLHRQHFGSGSTPGSGTSRPRTAHRVLWRRRYSPITSATFASSSGSVENLNVSAFLVNTPLVWDELLELGPRSGRVPSAGHGNGKLLIRLRLDSRR